jgi:hypothetical protein
MRTAEGDAPCTFSTLNAIALIALLFARLVILTSISNRAQLLLSFKTAFQCWRKRSAARASCRRRAARVQFFCFQDWKLQCASSKIESSNALKRALEIRLKEAETVIKELEKKTVLLKSKAAEASAASALMYGSRPEHLQQLHMSRAAELSAIHRAQQAEVLLAAAQLENELLKEKVEEQREMNNCMTSSQTSISQQLQHAQELNARLQEENSQLRRRFDAEVFEKEDLASQVQSLSAALKQQVTMMMKRSTVSGSHRS